MTTEDNRLPRFAEKRFPLLVSFTIQMRWFDQNLTSDLNRLPDDVTVGELESLLEQYGEVWQNDVLDNHQKKIMMDMLNEMLAMRELAISDPSADAQREIGKMLHVLSDEERIFLASRMDISLAEFAFLAFFYESQAQDDEEKITEMYKTIASKSSHHVFKKRQKFEADIRKITSTKSFVNLKVILITALAAICFFLAYQLSIY